MRAQTETPSITSASWPHPIHHEIRLLAQSPWKWRAFEACKSRASSSCLQLHPQADSQLHPPRDSVWRARFLLSSITPHEVFAFVRENKTGSPQEMPEAHNRGLRVRRFLSGKGVLSRRRGCMLLSFSHETERIAFTIRRLRLGTSSHGKSGLDRRPCPKGHAG